MKTLIRNAQVVRPLGVESVSVLVEGAKIAAIDPAVHTHADRIVDATGLHLIPGVIDDQVHFREPGAVHKEDLRTATRACAKGGVTTFFDMPNTQPTTTTQEALQQKLALAAQKSLVNYGFYLGATEHNVQELRRGHRTPGIKIFIGSSTGDLLVDGQEALEQIFCETSLPICAHCEDETTIRENRARWGDGSDVSQHSRIRDHRAALVATNRAMDLAMRHRHRFHVLHVSTAAEIPVLASCRPYVTAEACPHHLFFTVDDYQRLGTRVQMNPSVKTHEDGMALWQALHNLDIQVIATDHAPHTLEEKARPYPNSPSGLPAVENSLALMLNQVHLGRCTLSQVVHWMCDAPARVWDLMHKGRIEPGYDADLVLVDLQKKATILDSQQLTKCGWSPWHGTTLTGWPVSTWVMGHEVYRNGSVDDSRCGHEALFDHARGGYWSTA
ncbi:MAG: dihydroorotase [Planctomycetota bacterium]|nr:dihydroorotase [Planctomycetota bacterium]MDA1178776.1 dihydroorotase [Planctomycetota bacterium]